MRVMLISLPGIYENDGEMYPLGIAYLAGSIRGKHTVTAYHFQKMEDADRDIPRQFEKDKPEIVGLTCSTFNRHFVRRAIAEIRKLSPAPFVVVGGVHATYCSEQMLRNYGASAVVLGEGEISFPALCDGLEHHLPLSGIPGIAYLSDGAMHINPAAPTVQDLDQLALPDYTYALEHIKTSGIGYLITSRGCPVRCTFCSTSSFWGQKVRTLSPSRVVDQMEDLINRYSVSKIYFHDDTFNLGIERVKAVCSEIQRRRIQIEWACQCRVTPVSAEMINAMVSAGCRHIHWGIESGSETILRSIDKKIKLTQVVEAFELCKKHGDKLSTAAFVMVGNQGETARTINETMRFLKMLPITDSLTSSILQVLPGTKLYENLKNNGHVSDEDWLRYPFVPFCTLENSFLRLYSWQKQINRCGANMPFDRSKHFWRSSKLQAKPRILSTGAKVIKLISKPYGIHSLFNKLLFAGKIRF